MVTFLYTAVKNSVTLSAAMLSGTVGPVQRLRTVHSLTLGWLDLVAYFYLFYFIHFSWPNFIVPLSSWVKSFPTLH
jgi:hypothetical protein